MSDFRSKVYDSYVSAHKSFSEYGEELSKFEIKWNKVKYLPALKDMPKDAAILDIGCGSGKMMEYLRMEGFKNSEGIDLSEEQLEVAKARGLNVKRENVFTFFKENKKKYDVVIALDFVEHFTKEENMIIFEEVFKLLNSGGVMIIRTPNGQGLFPGRLMFGDFTHSTIFTPNSIYQVSKLAGFTRFKFLEAGPIAIDLLGFPRVIAWSIIKLVINLIKKIEAGAGHNLYTENLIAYIYK